MRRVRSLTVAAVKSTAKLIPKNGIKKPGSTTTVPFSKKAFLNNRFDTDPKAKIIASEDSASSKNLFSLSFSCGKTNIKRKINRPQKEAESIVNFNQKKIISEEVNILVKKTPKAELAKEIAIKEKSLFVSFFGLFRNTRSPKRESETGTMIANIKFKAGISF
jgi:hypothetical protein